jgi:hypothetical protein
MRIHLIYTSAILAAGSLIAMAIGELSGPESASGGLAFLCFLMAVFIWARSTGISTRVARKVVQSFPRVPIPRWVGVKATAAVALLCLLLAIGAEMLGRQYMDRDYIELPLRILGPVAAGAVVLYILMGLVSRAIAARRPDPHQG